VDDYMACGDMRFAAESNLQKHGSVRREGLQE
jgi:hypothetical protein